jgi:hypothetical protein
MSEKLPALSEKLTSYLHFHWPDNTLAVYSIIYHIDILYYLDFFT